MTTEDAPSDYRPAISDNEIIERFGGIRPMAGKLGVAVTTVQGWKERGHIPQGRWQQIAESAAAHGIDLGAGATAPAQEASPAAPPDEQPAAPDRPAAPRAAAAEKKKEAPMPKPAEAPPAAAESPPVKDTAPPAGPAASPPARRVSTPGVAWLALIVALGLGVAVLTRPYWESALHRSGFSGAGSVDPVAVDRILADVETMRETMIRMERDAGSRGAEIEGRIAALEAGGGEAGAAFAAQLAQVETQMAALLRSLEALSGSSNEVARRLATLESAQGRISEPVRRQLAEFTAQMDKLQAALEAQQGELKTGLGAVVKTAGALDARVTELETRPIQTGEKIAALALAIGQLEAAVDSGKPYRPALDRLDALGRDDPLIAESEALTILAPWADHGIPDRLALYRRYIEVTPQIARAIAATNEETWLDSVWNSLKGLVTIRRVDGDGELSPVSQAEIAMDRGDLTAAAAALDGAGSLGPEGEAWLALVKARIVAEREIETLYGRVIAPLAGTAKADPQ